MPIPMPEGVFGGHTYLQDPSADVASHTPEKVIDVVKDVINARQLPVALRDQLPCRQTTQGRHEATEQVACIIDSASPSLQGISLKAWT